MAGTPATPLSKIQRTPSCTPGGPKVHEEKILVSTVRMWPLNRKEQAMYDLIGWDCLDDYKIVFKKPTYERPTTSYTFDKVFDPLCSTQKVYEEGAKDVALSALTGINATIFAYGQTGSGKTFTMRGISENVVNDIYEHVKSNPERDFVLKISALEIYNETVVDLLNRESGSQRLLDDPELKGQVGETSLNDNSSISHLIIRLTIESSLRESSGRVESFVASAITLTQNLVDLAGSERASQTNADSIRLKEGSHINRSLLTLTTVLRKLSAKEVINNAQVNMLEEARVKMQSRFEEEKAKAAIGEDDVSSYSHFYHVRHHHDLLASGMKNSHQLRVNLSVVQNIWHALLEQLLASFTIDKSLGSSEQGGYIDELRKKVQSQMTADVQSTSAPIGRCHSNLLKCFLISPKGPTQNHFDC
ncbi:hypothetical protein Dsin_032273 [Dipteronia sinensis]|uniref:Kinesin motor domain-containing protein n=1 Tax=Dipteronia sinensis TaxID=43782 RepID=A0AAD9ZN86_9ROSI|nr:hypothetical protein Dsin_032273 [Dipteronia sinensis]